MERLEAAAGALEASLANARAAGLGAKEQMALASAASKARRDADAKVDRWVELEAMVEALHVHQPGE